MQQVGPPTFPVVLSGCQVHGQVNNEEGSPPPRHAGCPHTHTLLRAHKNSITSADENTPTAELGHFTCTAGSFLNLPS